MTYTAIVLFQWKNDTGLFLHVAKIYENNEVIHLSLLNWFIRPKVKSCLYWVRKILGNFRTKMSILYKN